MMINGSPVMTNDALNQGGQAGSVSPFACGQTYWRSGCSDRVGFIVDTEAYYGALLSAFEQARHSIYIIGWSFDPRTRLVPDGYEGPDDPDEVGHVLKELARARPDLDVRLLIWDAAWPIAAAHRGYPHAAIAWFASGPVRLKLDNSVPLGACHHQKIVVVDDALAFCGSGDIVPGRWDSDGHMHDEPRRLLPHQQPHHPRHEVAMLVDGTAAEALGTLFRERWQDAVGEELPARTPSPPLAWPLASQPNLKGASVYVARTLPRGPRGEPVEESRSLILRCIAQAKQLIVLENQYFTSRDIEDALAARLAEPFGPEVVPISTSSSPNWFDRMTMDTARRPMIARLRELDRHGRFRVFCPLTDGGSPIVVHSKVSIFDDKILCIGSSNMNNRSAAYDTECELAVHVVDDTGRAEIAQFRDKLISHYLGASSGPPGVCVGGRGLIAALDQLRSPRLAPLPADGGSPFDRLMGRLHLGDPRDRHESWRLRWRRR